MTRRRAALWAVCGLLVGVLLAPIGTEAQLGITRVGGTATAAAPAYTTGEVAGISLDLAGGLRIANNGTFVVQESGAALTALQLIDDAIATEDAAVGAGGFKGVPMLVQRQDAQSNLCADLDFCIPTINNIGELRVTMAAGTGGTAIADDADFADGTTIGTPIGGVAESAAPTAVTEGDFGWAAITLNRAWKVTLYTAAGVPVTIPNDATHDSPALTTGPGVMGDCDDTATDAIDEGDAGRLRIDCTTRAALAAPMATATSGAGATPISVASAASTNSTNVKASAGNLYSISLVNTTATLYYLRLYNLSSAPTCSSATGYIATVPVPASTPGAGIVTNIAVGAAFTTGIGYCITGGPTSTDNTNAAVGIYGFLAYK